jgi:hypothetical protein
VRESLERLTLGISCFDARDLRDFLQKFNDGAGDSRARGENGNDPETIGEMSDGGYDRQFVVTIQQSGRAYYVGLAQRRTAALALAVSLYRARHDGQLPTADLSALVPDYLPKIPGDPLSTSGESIVYVPGEGRPRVYSVGEDGIDDGGWPPEPYVTRAEELRMTDWVLDLTRQPRLSVPTGEQQRESPWRRFRG